MAEHRYWRVRGLTTSSGTGVSLAEIHLLTGGVRVDETATLSSSSTPLSGTLADLGDDDLGTICSLAKGSVLTWDFGLGNEVEIDGLRVAASDPQTAPFSVLLDVSDDNSTWSQYCPAVFDIVNAEPPWIDAVFNWSFANVAAIAQLDFAGTNGATSVTDSRGLHPWTFSGSAVLSDSDPMWSPTSLSLPSYFSDIRTAEHPNFDFGTGADFYIRIRFKATSLASLYGTLIACGTGTFVTTSTFLMVLSTGFLAFGTGQFNPILISSVSVSTGSWNVVELFRVNGQFFMRLNGAVVAQDLSGTLRICNFSFQETLIGRNRWDSANGQFIGSIGEVVVLRGTVAPIETASDPLKLPPYQVVFVPRSDGLPHSVVSNGGHDTPYSGVVYPGEHQALPDYNFDPAAKGRIVGTVARDADPTNIPLRRRVRLYRDRDGMFIRETWSDVAGNYQFDYLEENEAYTVIAHDHQFFYRAVVADNLKLSNGGVELMNA